jgi:adenylate cyclase
MIPDDEWTLVDLAREGTFSLGAAEVRPSTRELIAGDRPEVLEPRVMQVLVALARRRGQVVSRDDLIAACWGGRAVSEDAIQRCIAALRRVAETHGGFSVTTVARVGYRLDESEPAAIKSAPTAEPLLAVLAFDNLSGDVDMAYFQETVARGADLRVIGRTSSFQYRGADKDVRRVAGELKATHVLDGSVRKSGARVRISAQLIECAEHVTLWSDRFDRDLTDIFALQDEIAAAVAAALKVAFGATAKPEVIDPAAYDLYLAAKRTRTNDFFRNVKTLDADIERLEQATVLAPNFARAWALLADRTVSRLQHGDLTQPYLVMRSKVVEAAETALRLDPGLGYAYQALSKLEPFGAYLSREEFHRKALSIDSNDPYVLYEASWFSAEVGRIREALGYAEQAHDLDPMDPSVACQYVNMLDFLGRRHETRPLWDAFRTLWPDSELVAWNATASAALYGDWDRFDSLVGALRQDGLYTAQVRQMVWFGRNLRNPEPTSTQAAVNQARYELARLGHVPLESLSTLYRLGYRQEVFDLIDQSSFASYFDPQQRWPGGLSMVNIFAGVHNNEMMCDPRFVGLCAKIGLCDYWVKTGRWPDCAEAVAPYYDFKSECRRLAASDASGRA